MKKIDVLSILLALLLMHCPTGLEAREIGPPTDPLLLVKKEFLNPPNSARPWVYWFWINNCVTRKGITADLEAMKRVGIGGVLIMDIDLKAIGDGTPEGPVKFMDEQWKELFLFSASEAKRLGLEINMANDAGWTGSGGPWITPEFAMQTVVSRDTTVTGGKMVEIALPQPPSKGDFYRDIATLAVQDQENSHGYKIGNLAMKAVFAKSGIFNQFARPDVTTPVGVAIPPDKVIDISKFTDKSGHLKWEAPAGKWTIMRFGHTYTGAVNKPGASGGEGPECDKLSKEGVRRNFAGMMEKLVKLSGKDVGKTLVASHIDSWEVGPQNWTANMCEEFKKRRGYDIIPFLPVLRDRVLGNLQITERFLWDLRKTISELMVENYVAEMQKLCHEHGLLFSMEPYNTIGSDLDAANFADEPMSEFWARNNGDWYFDKVKGVSSAVHLNNRPIAGAESFTCAEEEKWLMHPANIKAIGDRFFCDGVNKFVFHRYAMQPWLERKPGMSMGPFGLHYERTQTWWDYSLPWHTYLSRCQYMLRQGTFVSDVLNLQPEEPIYRFKILKLTGYDYDACSPDAFRKVKVEDGQLVDGAGNKHSLLVLTHTGTMTVAQLSRIRDLVLQGASVLGEPPLATPGLADYPNADAKLKLLVDQLWGTSTDSIRDRHVGSGRVFQNIPVEEALKRVGKVPDFTSDQKLRYIHRKMKDTDIYFIANGSDSAVVANCSFRVKGKRPAWWDPETGRIRAITAYSPGNGETTRVPVMLDPAGSGFVVFFPGTESDMNNLSTVTWNGEPIMQNGTVSPASGNNLQLEKFLFLKGAISSPGNYEFTKTDGKKQILNVSSSGQSLQVTSPWKLSFPSKNNPIELTLSKLESWSTMGNKEVNYFSGTGKYQTTMHVPDNLLRKGVQLHLDLGRVLVMAKVFVNNKETGILWKAPYELDITSFVHSGENNLRIEVVNLWVNRQIGDENLPEDSERNPNGTMKQSNWPDWITAEKESPTGRQSFTSWRLWKKGDPLLESGLLGPVTLRVMQTME